MKDLFIYEVEPDYLRFLHKIDRRVSIKFNNRPYVGVVTMVNGIGYLIPLTSQTTERRLARGQKKRSSKTTSYIKDSSGKEIANLLYNNMIPITEQVCKIKEILPKEKFYVLGEVRYIRKHKREIVNKAKDVYENRTSKDNAFLNRICCDFKKLEKHYLKYQNGQ